MGFSELIRQRRIDLHLSIREVVRQTAQPFVPSPIKSAIYISRLETGDSEDMPIESVSIDKMWALGAVLHINPFELFLLSRGREDLVTQLPRFSIRTCLPISLGQFMRIRRAELKQSIRESAEFASPWTISSGYWSQVETDFRDYSGKVAGEKLWGIAVALNADPLLLYVLSRHIGLELLDPTIREELFT